MPRLKNKKNSGSKDRPFLNPQIQREGDLFGSPISQDEYLALTDPAKRRNYAFYHAIEPKAPKVQRVVQNNPKKFRTLFGPNGKRLNWLNFRSDDQSGSGGSGSGGGGGGSGGGGGGGNPDPPPPPQVDQYDAPGSRFLTGQQTSSGGFEGHNPLPWDTEYGTGIIGINRQRAAGLGAIQSQRSALQNDYGFAGSNPAAAPVGQFFDQSNPYSRAALLQKLYNRRKASTTSQMAQGGQLYSGAIQNARNLDTDDFNQDYDRLAKSFLSKKNQYAADEASVIADAENAAAQLFAQRLEKALSSANRYRSA